MHSGQLTLLPIPTLEMAQLVDLQLVEQLTLMQHLLQQHLLPLHALVTHLQAGTQLQMALAAHMQPAHQTP
jgi:hypothetical protein